MQEKCSKCNSTKLFVEIQGDKNDISMILVSAERYALGRRTYIVQWICEFIRNNLNLLTEKDKQVMIRDLENPISYGDECDKIEWLNLLEILKEDLRGGNNDNSKSR